MTLIFGDLNVFSIADAEALLCRVRRSLRPGGFFFDDVTTPQSSSVSKAWQKFSYHKSGLWSDMPYLELNEACSVRPDGLWWERYVIIEAQSGRATVYTTWSQEYTPDTITVLLKHAGLKVHTIYDTPGDSPLCDQQGWLGVLALKD